MNKRQKKLLQIAVAWMGWNYDEAVEYLAEMLEGAKCSNCKDGIIEFKNCSHICQSCGCDFGEFGQYINYNGEALKAPTQEEIFELLESLGVSNDE
jgi:hypothetical protein